MLWSVTHIYVYVFSKYFYPKQLPIAIFMLYMFYQYVCSLGIEPTTFCAITQCSTIEPQEH